MIYDLKRRLLYSISSLRFPGHFQYGRLCTKHATTSPSSLFSLFFLDWLCFLVLCFLLNEKQGPDTELCFSFFLFKNQTNMKEEQQASHHHCNNKRARFILKIFNSPATYVILLLLAYALGYLSAPSSPFPPPEPPAPTAKIFQLTNNLRTQLDNFRVTTHCADPLPSQLVRQTILDRIFNGSSPYVNFPPVHASSILLSQRIKGWGSYGAVFERLIQKVKPKVIVEVGTFLGASALHMAELTRQAGLDSLIICIDDFRGWPGFRDRFKYINLINGDVLLMYQFMQNVIYKNATETVIPVPFSSGSTLQKLCQWGVFADLIEVDAGHDFNSAWADINRAYRILRPGGVIFGHDYFTGEDNRGVRRAVNLFAQMNGLKIQTDGQHWVIDPAPHNSG